MVVVAMVLCSAVHEWAHAYTAYKLGDYTAARQGRLTLNPLVHIDPIGTLLLPAVGSFYGFFFGYARPVPFNPVNFTRKIPMKTATLLVALAGPVSNLIMAFMCGGLLRLVLSFGAGSDWSEPVVMLLTTGVVMNVILFIFNLLPVYPLDGSKILEGILPRRHHHILDFLDQNRLFVMMVILFVGIRFLGTPIRVLSGLVFSVFGLG